ncbi:MAG TPA: type II toxin-antitoxin system HipA family toxin [Ramlibacter sp.]|nr:type II toxin-antitoxin system HipA family toxin [Ramlibacter sp.]
MSAQAITRLHVAYRGWGESWPLGVLAQVGGRVLFEYTAEAVGRGIAFSPLHLPLPRPGAQQAAYVGPPHLQGLPGFIADSLPDGWGLLLMDRALRKAGRDPAGVSILERLAIVGTSAMGALVFEPAYPLEAEQAGVVRIAALARELQQVAQDAGEHAGIAQLHRLLLLGGSPQGARPKALLRWQQTAQSFAEDRAGPSAGEPWIFKFPGASEHAEVCAIETLYARLARAGGIEMPQVAHLALGPRHSAFGARRFDRAAARNGSEHRIPMLSLAALLHADYRLPALDYETVLLATARLTGDVRETAKAFQRCVFNVLTHNRDDHAKNFAFVLDAQDRWKLSPAFDLTFSNGPGGQHCTSLAGEGSVPTLEHLRRVARSGGLREADAHDAVNHWMALLQTPQPDLLADLPIRKTTMTHLRRTLETVWRAMR